MADEPRNDWVLWTRADVLARAGFTVSWNYGTKPEYVDYFKHWPGFFMFARLLPYLEPPADMSLWPPDRYTYSGVGQVNGKLTLGPAYINVDGTVSFRDVMGGFFIAPSPKDLGLLQEGTKA